MAKINFPNNRDQLVPPLPTGALQDGDTTNITADNVTITYVYKKPASPNTDSWWKSMGRVNNATPIDKIEEGDSSVEVIDAGSNGQVVVTTDGTARAKFRTDGSFVVGGSNLDTDPGVELTDDGSGIFVENVQVYGATNHSLIAGTTSGATDANFLLGADGSMRIGGSLDSSKVITNQSANININSDGSARFGTGITLNADGSGSFAGRVNTGGPTFDGIPISGQNNSTLQTLNLSNVGNGRLIKASNSGHSMFILEGNGDSQFGGTEADPNIKLNGNNGSAEFAGHITAGDQIDIYRETTTASHYLLTGKSDIGGTEQLKFKVVADGSAEFAGTISLTNGGAGIKFPAANTGNADPNTLDDYEEGTWTPTLNTASNGAGVTLTFGVASENFYTKVGNKVFVTCRIPITSSDSSQQVAVGDRITILPASLPFPVKGRGVNGSMIAYIDNNAPVRAAIFTISESQGTFICVYKQASVSYDGNFDLSLTYLTNT